MKEIALATMAEGIAHDLNNIIAMISGGMSEIENKPDRRTIEENIPYAKEGIRQAQGLTQQLVTYAKGLPVKKEQISIVNLIKRRGNYLFHNSKIGIINDFNDPDLKLEADETQITQVIDNILINAKHAMYNGGVIRIRANEVFLPEDNRNGLGKGEYILIEFEDEGIGIPQENLDKIFDPYFSSKSNGKGLGLSICNSIIKSHGGYIGVKSQLDIGTTFEVYLPVVNLSKNELELKY